jgi:hypothetical protein
MLSILNPPVGRLVAPGLVLAVVAAGTVTACGRSIRSTAPTAAASSSASPAAAAASPSAGGHDHTASAQAAASSGSQGAAAPGSEDQGAILGIRLQALLGQHTVLAADMMRARIRRDPDFAQAAETALTRNTQAMATLVGSAFGSDAATAFSQQWSGHITHLFEYAEARQAGDTGGLQRARQQLTESERAIASFFVKASNGRLPAATAEAGVRMHIEGLLAQADAYAKEDYGAADAEYQHAFQHTYALGGAIAAAVLPKKDAAALATPGLQLRSNLTGVLSEHVALVVAAMRAGSGNNTGDFRGLGNALNANTKALSGAIGTLFGAPAAARFQSLWADHVDGLMKLTSGTASGDTAEQEQGRSQLKAFEPALAAFLNTATQSRIGADALARALAMHDQMLLGEVEAFQAKDYAKAHDLGYSAYDAMFGLAGQLSHAMALTLADKLPKGGSQTGGGGMAGVVGRR